MQSSFSQKEKRNYMFKKHLKNHLFEYVLDFIGPILLTVLLLYLCKAENIAPSILFAIAYSFGKILYNLHYYKKEYIDIDIK